MLPRKQHESEACLWFEKAARHGYQKAQHMLGVRYAKGLGVEKDYLHAYAGLFLANDSDDSHISEALRRVRDKLSEEQVSEAEILASEFCQVYERKLSQPTT
ncbi:MAG: hypothetical protein O7D86_10435 [Proteobacteria bacterium]|nr:hypothetical protein [Pseudomonadota bacterium]